MSTSAGPWLANLVMDHADDLAAGMAPAIQRQIPLYATWDRLRVHQTVHLFYQALAQVFATGDMAPVRNYLSGLVSARSPTGTSGTDYIWLLDRVEEHMRTLVTHQLTEPRRVQEAQRLIRSTSRNARLIVSELNLQAITRASPRGKA